MHINTEFTQRNLSRVVCTVDTTAIKIHVWGVTHSSLQEGKKDIFSPMKKEEKIFPKEKRFI